MSSVFRTDEIMVLLGGDFQFMNAFKNYVQTDRVIEYMKKHHSDRYIFKYSTPSIYVEALKKHNVEWEVKTDDLMPYVSEQWTSWTGFYTSRPNNKVYIKRLSGILHASSNLYAKLMFDPSMADTDLEKILAADFALRDALGIVMHHDAITGTGDQLVADTDLENCSGN